MALTATLISVQALAEDANDCPSGITTGSCIMDTAEWSGKFRGRYEMADDSVNDSAHAITGRVSFQYKSRHFNHWRGIVELEHVFTADNSSYFDGGSSLAGIGHATVADPTGTEVNQGYVQYTGLPNFDVRFGRQQYSHRAYPWQRFLGTVSWRQNEQTVDGVTLGYTNQNQLNINAAYLYNVNRIFGRGNPIPNRKSYSVEAFILNGNYAISPTLKVDVYLFNVDFPKAESLSAITSGLRLDGTFALGDVDFSYAGEFASQSPDGTDRPGTDDRTIYTLMQFGSTLVKDRNIKLKLTREFLEGTGIVSFKTPLATLHAYQGWTDKFLSTPPFGVEDLYLSISGTLNQANWLFVVHQFQSDAQDFKYGSEYGASISFPVGTWQAGAKFAVYSAASTLDIQCGIAPCPPSPWARDTTKFWTWIQRSF